MSELLHPGQHPDADQLSAFAEHVLPDHERLETLAHLAECPHCREIVFLAQRAHEVQDTVPHAPPSRTGWLRNWPVLWPVVAALTCGVVVVVVVQHRRPANLPQSSTIAVESSAPPAPSVTDLPPRSVSAPTLTAKPSNRAKAVTSPQAASTGPDASAAGTDPVGSNLSVNGSLSRDQLHGNLSAFNRVPTAVDKQSGEPRSDAFLAGNAVGGPVAQTSSSLEQKKGLLATGRARTGDLQTQNPLFSQQANIAPSPSVPNQSDIQHSTSQTVSVAGAAPVLRTQSPVLSTSAFSGIAAQAKSARPSLPSNRPAASTISNGHETLALDSAGDLFLSKDSGVGWQSVAHQWTGKAIKVSLASPVAKTQPLSNAAPSSEATPSTTSETVPLAPMARRVGFELTTDTGAIWSSPDGLVWKRQ